MLLVEQKRDKKGQQTLCGIITSEKWRGRNC